MNDFIQAVFINPPPAPARGGADPLLPVRRSFGEGDLQLPPPSRARRRHRFTARPKRAAA
jgi:hypothetical protein